MAIETLRPNGAGALTGVFHQVPNSGAHWQKVDEVTADFNTTAVFSKTNTSGPPPEPQDPPP